MVRSIITAVVAAFLLVHVTVAAPAVPRLIESVRGLDWTDPLTHEVWHHCSISQIDSTRHYWLTAAHCVAIHGEGDAGEMTTNVADLDYQIEGAMAKVVFADFPADIAVLQTLPPSYRIPALRLAKHAPWFLDEVKMAGYPYGEGPEISVGYVAMPVLISPYGTYMIYHLSACPGNSGSPVVNAKGEIVSLLQVAYSRDCAVRTGGAPFEVLREAVGSFFGR